MVLIGSATMLAVGACHSDRERPSGKDAGDRKAAGVSVATISFVDTAHKRPGAIPGEDYPTGAMDLSRHRETRLPPLLIALLSRPIWVRENVGPITASFFHKRLSRDGVLTVDVSMLLREESVPYAIRLQQFVSSAPLRPTGQRAFLTIGSKADAEKFAVIPLSRVQPVTDLSPWQLYAGSIASLS